GWREAGAAAGAEGNGAAARAAKGRNAAPAERWVAVLRRDLGGDKDVRMLVHAGGSFGEMGLDREPAGRAGGEGHLGGRARDNLLLDVIAMQMNGHGSIGAPLKLDHIIMLDADQPQVLRHMTVLDTQGESHLGGARIS